MSTIVSDSTKKRTETLDHVRATHWCVMRVTCIRLISDSSRCHTTCVWLNNTSGQLSGTEKHMVEIYFYFYLFLSSLKISGKIRKASPRQMTQRQRSSTVFSEMKIPEIQEIKTQKRHKTLQGINYWRPLKQ